MKLNKNTWQQLISILQSSDNYHWYYQSIIRYSHYIMNPKSKAIGWILVIYALLYLGLFFIEPLISYDPNNPDFQVNKLDLITTSFAFIIYLIGTIYVWKNEKVSGIILCVWHFIIWLFALLFWRDAGMVLAMAFPILFPGVLLIRNWYIQKDESYTSEAKQWDLSLKVLLINYAAIYLLIVFANVVPKLVGWELPTRVDEIAKWDYTSFTLIMLLLALLLFVIGFIISWRSKLFAGIIFILWYVLIIFMTKSSPEFADTGPSILFGITILVQGIFYIICHYRFVRLGSQLN